MKRQYTLEQKTKNAERSRKAYYKNGGRTVEQKKKHAEINLQYYHEKKGIQQVKRLINEHSFPEIANWIHTHKT